MSGRPCTDEVRVKVPSFQKVTLFSVIITIHHERQCRIEISHPRGRKFNQGRSMPRPWLNSDPEGEIKSVRHMYCNGTRKSHPRTRIFSSETRLCRVSDEIIQVRGWDFRVPQQYILMDTFSRPLCDFLRFYMNSVSSA